MPLDPLEVVIKVFHLILTIFFYLISFFFLVSRPFFYGYRKLLYLINKRRKIQHLVKGLLQSLIIQQVGTDGDWGYVPPSWKGNPTWRKFSSFVGDHNGYRNDGDQSPRRFTSFCSLGGQILQWKPQVPNFIL